MLLLYIVPSIWLASAAQQKILLHALCSTAGNMSSLLYTMLSFVFFVQITPGGAGNLMVDVFGLVLWTPFGIFFMCSFALAVKSGRYFLTTEAVSPRHDLKCPLLMGLIHVDGGGLNAH